MIAGLRTAIHGNRLVEVAVFDDVQSQSGNPVKSSLTTPVHWYEQNTGDPTLLVQLRFSARRIAGLILLRLWCPWPLRQSWSNVVIGPGFNNTDFQ